MKNKIIIAAAAGSTVIIAAAVWLAVGISHRGVSSVPELVFPDREISSVEDGGQVHGSSDSGDPVSTVTVESVSSAAENTSSAHSTTLQTTADNVVTSESSSAAETATEEITSSAVTEHTAHSDTVTTSVSSSSTSRSSDSSRSSSSSSRSSSDTTADSRTEDIAESSESSEYTDEEIEPVETTPQNVLLTSADPQHYIRFEFLEDRVNFSGVYSGDKITEVYVFHPNIICRDLECSGDFFSGSLDLSGLSPGYYIIVVRTESYAGMYYVFEMTQTTSRPVPADELPAQRNWDISLSPIELQEDGVLLHITPDGDKQKAAELLQQVKEISDMVCEGLTDDYSKARALAVWVSQNMYYDHDAKDRGNIDEVITLEYVLKYHRSVCFGWTNLYSALCQAQGIDCYNASGSVVTGSRCFLQTSPSDERSHSWNMVIIDGRRIWVDTVWDSSNSYEYGEYFSGPVDYQYFDMDNTLLSHDHRVTRFEHRSYFP